MLEVHTGDAVSEQESVFALDEVIDKRKANRVEKLSLTHSFGEYLQKDNNWCYKGYVSFTRPLVWPVLFSSNENPGLSGHMYMTVKKIFFGEERHHDFVSHVQSFQLFAR